MSTGFEYMFKDKELGVEVRLEGFEGFEEFEGFEGFDGLDADGSIVRLLDIDKYFMEQNSKELKLETTNDKSLYVYRKGIRRIMLEINRPDV